MGQDRDAQSDKGGLSLTGLIIASASSAAAAVIVHALWEPGTVIAAAATPVLMSLFAEALRRPAERVMVRTGGGGRAHATVEVQREGRRWRQALVAGLAAFALGATALTVSELLLQRTVADREGDTTLFDSARPAPTSTPSPTAQPTPGETRTQDEPRDPESRSGTPGQPSPTPAPTGAPAQSKPTRTPTPPVPTPTPP